MSLYYVQKLLFNLNRDPEIKRQFEQNPTRVLSNYTLTDEELKAVTHCDIGLLYVSGVNGQLLMHFATMQGLSWQQYIQAMRDGVDQHGPVRDGLYTMRDGQGAI